MNLNAATVSLVVYILVICQLSAVRPAYAGEAAVGGRLENAVECTALLKPKQERQLFTRLNRQTPFRDLFFDIKRADIPPSSTKIAIEGRFLPEWTVLLDRKDRSTRIRAELPISSGIFYAPSALPSRQAQVEAIRPDGGIRHAIASGSLKEVSLERLYARYAEQSSEVSDHIASYKSQDRKNAIQFYYSIDTAPLDSPLDNSTRLDFVARSQILLSDLRANKLNVEDDFPALNLHRADGQIWAEIGRTFVEAPSNLSSASRDLLESLGGMRAVQRRVLLDQLGVLNNDIQPVKVVMHVNAAVLRVLKRALKARGLPVISEIPHQNSNGTTSVEYVVGLDRRETLSLERILIVEEFSEVLHRIQKETTETPNAVVALSYTRANYNSLQKLGFFDALKKIAAESTLQYRDGPIDRQLVIITPASAVPRLSEFFATLSR